MLTQLTDETDTALKRSLVLVANREEQATLVGTQFAEHEKKLAEAVGINKKLKDQFDHIDEQDLLPDQLQTIAMLQKQIESLEDQVIDRDAALQEIESQMKQDYEQHDQLIRKLNSEVQYRPTCVYVVFVLFFRAQMDPSTSQTFLRTVLLFTGLSLLFLCFSFFVVHQPLSKFILH